MQRLKVLSVNLREADVQCQERQITLHIWQSDEPVWVWILTGKCFLLIGCFSEPCPLTCREKKLNSSSYKEILNNFMISTLWEQFAISPFLFNHVCTVVKDRAMTTRKKVINVDELD